LLDPAIFSFLNYFCFASNKARCEMLDASFHFYILQEKGSKLFHPGSARNECDYMEGGIFSGLMIVPFQSHITSHFRPSRKYTAKMDLDESEEVCDSSNLFV